MYTFLAALKDLWDFIWGMDQRPAEKKSEPEIFLIATAFRSGQVAINSNSSG